MSVAASKNEIIFPMRRIEKPVAINQLIVQREINQFKVSRFSCIIFRFYNITQIRDYFLLFAQ